MDGKELLAAIAQGDDAALRELFQRHAPWVAGRLRRMLPIHAAEDVLDYDMTFKPPEQDALFEPTPYRSSDHDPVVVGLFGDRVYYLPIIHNDPVTQ